MCMSPASPASVSFHCVCTELPETAQIACIAVHSRAHFFGRAAWPAWGPPHVHHVLLCALHGSAAAAMPEIELGPWTRLSFFCWRRFWISLPMSRGGHAGCQRRWPGVSDIALQHLAAIERQGTARVSEATSVHASPRAGKYCAGSLSTYVTVFCQAS